MSAAADSNPPGELYCTACEKTFHIGDRCPTDGTRLLRLKARIDPFLGRDLDGRYTVLEKLGSGGMGAVYRAEQHSVDREVAIKVINSSLVSEPEVIKRFLREAKLATRLSHPNAVTVLDFGQTEDGVFFLVMELVAGRTLDDVIKAERQFKPERVVRIGIQICDALEGAHQLSIIHRDLKPSNIMLMATGRDFVKVLDFGLAKSTSPDQTSTTMTGAGAVVGTPAFMPPELAMGEPCDARSDLYSLGVILYLLGSGRLPFMSESVHELLAMHASDDPAPPMHGVPPKLARVIDKLLAKKPADRYQSSTDARTALEESLIVTTPMPMSAIPDDTHPSIGPFPATTQQFAGLHTPVPQSLIEERTRVRPDQTPVRPRASTELDRMMRGETMLAGAGAPAAAQPHPDVSSPSLEAPKKKRWPIVAGALAVLGAGGIVLALTMGGDGDKAPAESPPPPAMKTPTPPPTPPAPPRQDVVAPPQTPPANDVTGKAPETPPVQDAAGGKPKTVKTGRGKTTKTVKVPPVGGGTPANMLPIDPPSNPPPQNPPPSQGSGVKLPF